MNEFEKAKSDFNLDFHTKQWLDRCEENNGTQAVEDIQVHNLSSMFLRFQT